MDAALGRTLSASTAGCDGAVVLDVLAAPAGEVQFLHQALCLQRWLNPLTVRPLHAGGDWRMLRPQMRLWQPQELQHFAWQGSVRQNFVVVTRERVARIVEQASYERSGIEHWAGHDFDDKAVQHLVTAMIHDCAEHSPAGPLVIDALVTALVARLAALAPLPRKRTRMAPGRMQRVLDFIEAQLHRPLGLDELAALAGVGQRHFLTAFRDTVGATPHQLVLQRRVERAKRLLRDPTLGLADIACAVGFTDQSQFTRTFGRITGMTPGRYRKELIASR